MGKSIIIGGDGSGKALYTLLANIGQIYTCAQLNVGRPYGTLLNSYLDKDLKNQRVENL